MSRVPPSSAHDHDHDPAADMPSPAGPGRLARADAESLGERIQRQAAHLAEATCELLLMLADFDAREGVGWFVGLKSTAHWLAWSCSMSPGTAREHVRVARALPSMPRTVAEFRAGRLSYSKVREMTRVADRVEEEQLVELARCTTASQLARAVSSFRAIDGSRLGQDAVREARWRTREDGMVEIRAVLPAEAGAEMITALETALQRDGTAVPSVERTDEPSVELADEHAGHPASEDTLAEAEADVAAAEDARATTAPTLAQRRADAVHEVARGFLAAAPGDRSGEDRHLVVVQVDASALVHDGPAANPEHLTDADAGRVPSGTPQRCGVVGGGSLETRTAERLACTGRVAIVLTDAGGEILHLGRARRLASRAQRRALRLRDGTCCFPGCHQSRNLDAHHVTPWSQGGLTDIEGLALVCRRHHVIVHEGGLRLVPLRRPRARGGPRFRVVDESGTPVQARWPAMFEHVRTRPAPSSPSEPAGDGARIAATTGGAGFRLADCVELLCRSVVGLAA
ncbi:HNH endonuclease signature motif containing protein [Brachybacterium sacelli]|uniref:HNH nuclease domain-containing protein n=1 Tax=Brachybacterium sacelli TaxID=173364 RepID=A0ABS4X4V9_9MICO|nr:HNH endonuclease signature motif containing protein [Brachybacterium sacelli]MBP2383502.1 hypothetical protein [Brachybacterium sacelli]